jgi:hypothetical protein
VGVAIVASAYFFRGSAAASPDLNDPKAFAVAVPQRIYQDEKDTDGDGIRDWLEELMGTNPLVSDANGTSSAPLPAVGSSTKPFVADTETKKFAISFFDDVLKTHGGRNLSDQEKQAILDSSVGRFVSLSTSTLYTRNNIEITQTSDADSIKAYGNALGAVIVNDGKNSQKVDSELVVLAQALQDDNASELAKLAPIKAGYALMIADVQKVPVPESLVNQHLLLLNSLEAIRADIDGFEKTFTDPLMSYVRFKRYLSDGQGLAKAVDGIRTGLEHEHVVYEKTEPGQFFFSLRP